MAIAPSEAEILVAELETRLDRLRALYEQYFLGFEKLEPLIPRKDVDRRFDVIRRLHFRNTALRFKFNMLQQRYNTFQMYWLRICRQIEEGTYQRHLNKAKKRAELEKSKLTNVDEGWDVEIDASETPEDLFASFEAAKTAPPTAPPVFSIPPAHLTSLGVDDPFALSMPPPQRKPKSDSPGSSPIPPAPNVAGILPGAFRPSIPPRIAPGSLVQGAEKKPVILRKAEPAGPRTTVASTPAPMAHNAPPTIIAPPFAPPTIMAPPPTMSFAPAPLLNSKAPPALSKTPPKSPPSAPKATPATSKAPPRPPPSTPKATPATGKAPPPKQPPSAPKAAPQSSKAPPRPPLPSGATKGTPLVRPKAPEGQRIPAKGEDDRKMRVLYSEYIEQKKSRNESTAHLSYDTVAKSLKESGSKLAAKHEGKRVDFEVAVKDGATVLRPVIK